MTRSRLSGLVTMFAAVALFAACSSSSKKSASPTSTTSTSAAATSSPPTTSAPGTSAPSSATLGAFAKSEFTTPLAGVCPNPIVLQTDWLPEADHGFAYELIGGGGTMSQYTYEGPLGSTGVNLEILAGGPGLGDGVSQPSSLYVGNLVKGVTPTLSFVSLDDAIQYSRQYPVTQVFAQFNKSPLLIIYDPTHYTIHSLADLKAATAKGAKFYVTSTTLSFVRWMESQGIASVAFIGGYSGDLQKFMGGAGQILNQGSLYDFMNLLNLTPNAAYAYVNDMGFPFYQSAVSVATDKLQSLAPCLAKLVPLMQKALVDYVRNPIEVNQLIATYNDKGFGAAFWKPPTALTDKWIQPVLEDGVIANTPETSTVGGFDLNRVKQIISDMVPINKAQGITSQNANVTPADVASNQFIDPSIGLRPGCPFQTTC